MNATFGSPSPLPPEVAVPPEQWVLSVKCVTLLVILLMTLSSNLFVLWAVLVRRGSRRRSVAAGRRGSLSRVQLFIVHLSIADILVALLNILPQLAWDLTVRFEGGFVLCKLVKYAQVLVLYLSTYILTGMSLDRLISMRAIYAQWRSGMRPPPGSLAACRPLSSLDSTSAVATGTTHKPQSRVNIHHSRIGYRKVAKLLILLAWTLSAVLALPQLFIFSYVATVPPGVTPSVPVAPGVAATPAVAAEAEAAAFDPADHDLVYVLDGDGDAGPLDARQQQLHNCLASFSWHPYGMEIYATSFVIIILGVPTLLMLFCYGHMCLIILRIQRGHEWGHPSQLLEVATAAVPAAGPPPGSATPTMTTTGMASAPGSVADLSSSGGSNVVAGGGGNLVAAGGGFAASSERLIAAKLRLVKMTFAVVLCFIVCWSPFCVAVLLRAYTLPVDNAHASPLIMVLLLLAALNSAVNPWIYAAFYANHLFKRSRRKLPTSTVNVSSSQMLTGQNSHHQLNPLVISSGRR